MSLRKELLQKAVVAAANLEDQVRPRNGSIRQRNNIYVCRCCGVISGRAAARVEHAQRKKLCMPWLLEVASGQQSPALNHADADRP